jgi:CheY-like chemotaxis protein
MNCSTISVRAAASNGVGSGSIGSCRAEPSAPSAVRVAYSSDAALEQAAADKADVVLLDIALPDMDGFELATRLRDLLPSAMFLAVSGHAGEAFQAKARAVGIEQYFVKPVAVAKLREVLDSVAKRS